MRKTIFFILMTLPLVLSCSNKVLEKNIWSSGAYPAKMSQKTQVKVLANSEEIAQGESPESVLWSKAEKQGIQKINNYWLNKRLLIKASNNTAVKISNINFLQHKGQFSAKQDPVTQVYSQEFRLRAEFYPYWQFAGRIASFKDQQTLAGQYDYVTLDLFEQIQVKEAYFLIARKEIRDKTSYFRLIGAGKLYHSIGEKAQGLLLETVKEVMAGDVVFFLQVEVEPHNNRDPLQTMNGKNLDELVVEPEGQPKSPSLPLDPK